MMTQKKYIEEEGELCPKCESADISVGEYDPNGTYIWCSCFCNKCSFEWTDEYKLTGFEPCQQK